MEANILGFVGGLHVPGNVPLEIFYDLLYTGVGMYMCTFVTTFLQLRYTFGTLWVHFWYIFMPPA